MWHGRPDYNRIQDPEGVIPVDEPVFLLRAQDPLSAAIVRAWANLNRMTGGDDAMSQVAEQVAGAMDAWPIKKSHADMPGGNMQYPALPGMPQALVQRQPTARPNVPEHDQHGPGRVSREQVRNYMRMMTADQLDTFGQLLAMGTTSRMSEYAFFPIVQPLFTEERGTKLHPATQEHIKAVIEERTATAKR